MTPALIIGSGICGPVTAMALQRAHIKSVVYEAGGPATGDEGPYVTVAANGLDALAAIGVDGLVAAGGFVTRSTAFFRGSGQHLGTIGMGRDSVTIRHTRLERLLQEEASSRGIPFEFGKRLAGAGVAPCGAEAWFQDRSFETGGLLIGCDGVHSEVRQIIDPEARPPRNLGLLNFRGYTPSIDAGTPGRWQMIFGRRGFFSYAVDPAGGTAWLATIAATPVVEHHGVTSNEDWMRILVNHFDGDAGPAIPLIADGTLELTASPTDDLPHVRRWHRGALIVIGDAAHASAPASGQGVSLAIEDGVLLAKYLRQLPTAPAFEAFTRARRGRVERVVARGARASCYRVPSSAGRAIRDLTLPFVFRHLMTERALAWMHNHRVEWHQPVVNA